MRQGGVLGSDQVVDLNWIASVVDWMVATPQKIYPPRTSECDFILNKILCRCNLGQDLKMRPSRIKVGSKSNDKFPCKRQKRRRQTQRKSMWRQRERSEWCCHKPRNTWNHQKLEEERKDSPLQPSEGAQPCWHLDFRLWGSRTMRILFCCIKPIVVICYGSPRKLIQPEVSLRICFFSWTLNNEK